jgi:hypothetical protein
MHLNHLNTIFSLFKLLSEFILKTYQILIEKTQNYFIILINLLYYL